MVSKRSRANKWVLEIAAQFRSKHPNFPFPEYELLFWNSNYLFWDNNCYLPNYKFALPNF
jgi:hypothetical protein